MPQKSRFSNSEIKKMSEMSKSTSLKEIADKFGISTSSVAYFIRTRFYDSDEFMKNYDIPNEYLICPTCHSTRFIVQKDNTIEYFCFRCDCRFVIINLEKLKRDGTWLTK